MSLVPKSRLCPTLNVLILCLLAGTQAAAQETNAEDLEIPDELPATAPVDPL